MITSASIEAAQAKSPNTSPAAKSINAVTKQTPTVQPDQTPVPVVKLDQLIGDYYCEDLQFKEASDLDLLYLPMDSLSEYTKPSQKTNFTPFHHLRGSEGYTRRKNKLTDKFSPINSMCKRLIYNHEQRDNYLKQVSEKSSQVISQIIEGSAKWEKKKEETNMKIVKRNPFNQSEDVDEKRDRSNFQNRPTVNANIVSFFPSEEERKKHIKIYRLAWYPPSEPTYKNIESLEGSTATQIGKQVFVLGGLRNSSNNAFFCYEVDQDKFQALETKGFPPQCVVYHTAVAMEKNIYLFGGDSGLTIANSKVITNELYRFNTVSLEWNKLKPLKSVEPRKHHAACEFGDFMLVSGGLSEDSNIPFRDFHAYDPDKNEWFKIFDNVEWAGLSHHTMTPVFNHKIKNLYGKAAGQNKNKIDAADVRLINSAHQ